MHIPNPLERLAVSTDKRGSNDCWPWIGKRRMGTNDEYGAFSLNGKSMTAHRAAYILLVGPVPDENHVHHTCQNTLCVNPEHLQSVTRKVHYADLTPGHKAYEYSHRTHCKHGHELSGDNVSLKHGYRLCRTCARKRSADQYAAYDVAEFIAHPEKFPKRLRLSASGKFYTHYSRPERRAMLEAKGKT